jgi:diguanylate cyclase (GGDEF)-like protein
MRAARFFHHAFNSLHDGVTDAQLRQFLFIFGFSSIGILVLPVLAGLYLTVGAVWLAVLNLGVTALTALNLLLLQRHRNVRIAENVVLALLLVALFGGLFSSIEQTGPYWFSLFPAAAFFLKGLKRGLAATALLIAGLGFVVLLQKNGLMATEVSSAALLVLMANLLALSGIIGISQAILADAEERVNQRSAALSKEILERHSVDALLRKSEEQIRFMAHRDPLTSLPNRSLCYDRLEQALLAAQRHHHNAAVLLFDIDEFRALNEVHGMEMGDRVLREVAKRLRERVRGHDTVGRVGIDEFLVILSEVDDVDDVVTVTAELLHAISQPLTLDEQTFQLTASVGSARFPADGTVAADLIALADTRLFDARADQRSLEFGSRAFSPTA